MLTLKSINEETVWALREMCSKLGSLEGFKASVSIMALRLLNFSQVYFYHLNAGTSILRYFLIFVFAGSAHGHDVPVAEHMSRQTRVRTVMPAVQCRLLQWRSEVNDCYDFLKKGLPWHEMIFSFFFFVAYSDDLFESYCRLCVILGRKGPNLVKLTK